VRASTVPGRHPPYLGGGTRRSGTTPGGVVGGWWHPRHVDQPALRSGPFWEAVDGRRPPPPAAALLGWKAERIDPEHGEAEVSFTATEAFTNPMGTVQGGFLAAMLDDTLGPALVCTLGPAEFPLTLELKVNYLRPARPGQLRGIGRIVHRGGTVAFLAGELLGDSGEVLATATATVRIVRSS